MPLALQCSVCCSGDGSRAREAQLSALLEGVEAQLSRTSPSGLGPRMDALKAAARWAHWAAWGTLGDCTTTHQLDWQAVRHVDQGIVHVRITSSTDTRAVGTVA